MPDVKISAIAKLTGLSVSHWQKRFAAGEVPGAKAYERGRRRIYLIDEDTFVAWWSTQTQEIKPCQDRVISTKGAKSGGREYVARVARISNEALKLKVKQLLENALPDGSKS
jgi:hypothetical protein